MPWIPLALAAVGAAQGAAQRQAQQKVNQAQADISAAETRYSPWTGIKPQGVQLQAPTTSGFQGAVQGGLSGLMYNAKNPATEKPVIMGGQQVPPLGGQEDENQQKPWGPIGYR